MTEIVCELAPALKLITNSNNIIVLQSLNTINSSELFVEEKIMNIIVKTKICSVCNIIKDIDQFEHHRSQCKTCRNIYKMSYGNVLKKFIRKLYDSSLAHSKTREEKGKVNASEHSITIDDIYSQYSKQNGKCIYSNIIMSHKPLSDFMMSLERTNNDIGYTKENITLSCSEFNSGKSYWNKNKINLVLELRKTEVDMNILVGRINEALNPEFIYTERKKREEKYINDIKYVKCNKCNIFRESNHFTKGTKIVTECHDCSNKKSEFYRTTLRGFLLRLLGCSRKSNKRRETLNNKNLEHSITLKNLCDLILKQQGRCYYSSIPLVYKSNSDWLCSIERLDNSKGYTLDNIVLICNEFNTADRSYKSTNPFKTGSSMWSVEKMAIFIKHLEEIKLSNPVIKTKIINLKLANIVSQNNIINSNDSIVNLNNAVNLNNSIVNPNNMVNLNNTVNPINLAKKNRILNIVSSSN